MRDDEVKDIIQSDALIRWEAGLRMTVIRWVKNGQCR